MTDLHYKVCAPGGASGHFLGHFLHPEYKANSANIRIDTLNQLNPIYEYTQNDDDGHTHDMHYTNDSKKVLRILTPTRNEKIKAAFNTFYKHVLDNNFNLATVFNRYYDNLLTIENSEYNHCDINNTISVHYKDVFNLLYLSEIYYTVNKTICPDYKVEYAHSYISKHVKLYSNWSYNVLVQVFNFEYDNNLIESVSGRMRNWSIDEINEDNWQEFLEEKLCLTNYS